MADGCYTRGEIMDLAAHHIVWTGEAPAVEARMRAGFTLGALLRERYSVFVGEGCDETDAKRFRGLLKDARWRIRKIKDDEKRRAHRRRVTAWNGTCPEG